MHIVQESNVHVSSNTIKIFINSLRQDKTSVKYVAQCFYEKSTRIFGL